MLYLTVIIHKFKVLLLSYPHGYAMRFPYHFGENDISRSLTTPHSDKTLAQLYGTIPFSTIPVMQFPLNRISIMQFPVSIPMVVYGM